MRILKVWYDSWGDSLFTEYFVCKEMADEYVEKMNEFAKISNIDKWKIEFIEVTETLDGEKFKFLFKDRK